MPQFDIWVTGSNDMGNITPTQKLNAEPIAASSFDEAVKILTRNPEIGPWIEWNDKIGFWTMWALRLFPDEASAKAVFGY